MIFNYYIYIILYLPKPIPQKSTPKQNAKMECDATQDPGAKILIFIGRWVKQKGVDHIAMLTKVGALGAYAANMVEHGHLTNTHGNLTNKHGNLQLIYTADIS